MGEDNGVLSEDDGRIHDLIEGGNGYEDTDCRG